MNFQINSLVKKRLNDERGQTITKSYRVDRVLPSSQDYQVMNILDVETMTPQTLKIIHKNANLVKSKVVNQIRNQKALSNRENFIGLSKVYEDNQDIYLFMDLWGTSLADVLGKRLFLTQAETQLILNQLVDILEALRASNISHGKISLNSLFLHDQNKLKLGDFSQSIDMKIYLEHCLGSTQLTESEKGLQSDKFSIQEEQLPQFQVKNINRFQAMSKEISHYTSPEEYYEEKSEEEKAQALYSKDVWMCGVILFKCLTGILPCSADEKICLDKIKHASFMFPNSSHPQIAFKIHKILNMNQFAEFLLENIYLFKEEQENSKLIPNDYISPQWKELLKKILTVRTKRITLKELLNHPLKRAVSKNTLGLLTDCVGPNISSNLFVKNEQASMGNIFKEVTKTAIVSNWQRQSVSHFTSLQNYKYTWDIGEEGKSIEPLSHAQPQVDTNSFKVYFEVLSKLADKGKQEVQGLKVGLKRSKEDSIRESVRESINKNRNSLKNNLKSKPDSASLPPKIQLISRQEVIAVLLQKCLSHPMALLSKPPTFVTKFRYFKRMKCFGYVINNEVGVVYEDNHHVIGHSKTEFRYIEGQRGENKQSNSKLVHPPDELLKIKRSIHKSRLAKNSESNLEESAELEKASVNHSIAPSVAPSITPSVAPCGFSCLGSGQQWMSASRNSSLKPTQQIVESFPSSSLSPSKREIYEKCIQYFGERMIKTQIGLWVETYWRDGNVYVLLLSNGSWEVIFQQKKTLKIYVIDEDELSWSLGCSHSVHIANIAREIVRSKRESILAPK